VNSEKVIFFKKLNEMFIEYTPDVEKSKNFCFDNFSAEDKLNEV